MWVQAGLKFASEPQSKRKSPAVEVNPRGAEERKRCGGQGASETLPLPALGSTHLMDVNFSTSPAVSQVEGAGRLFADAGSDRFREVCIAPVTAGNSSGRQVLLT